jgi:hypothetical protein
MHRRTHTWRPSIICSVRNPERKHFWGASVIGVAPRQRDGRSGVEIPAEASNFFFFLQNIQIGCGAFFPGGTKRPERYFGHKNYWGCATPHLYAFTHGLRRIFLLSGKGDMRCDVGIDRREKVKLAYEHMKGTNGIQVASRCCWGAIDKKKRVSIFLFNFLTRQTPIIFLRRILLCVHGYVHVFMYLSSYSMVLKQLGYVLGNFFFCGSATQRESWSPHSWGF